MWFWVGVVLITELGIVLTHVWGREDHAHPAHRPWVGNLGVANWFHVASFLSHWLAVVSVLYLAAVPLVGWVVAGAGSWCIWQLIKRAANKRWSPWLVQLARFIRDAVSYD